MACAITLLCARANMYDSAKTNGETHSFWYSQLSPTHEESLAGDGPIPDAIQEVDVAVIGAGMAGLSAAYHLCKAGRSVTVIDKGLIGCGETGRTSAHLSNALDDRYAEIEKIRGADAARLAAGSHAAAIADIEAIARTEKIACELERVPGFLASSKHDPAAAEQELRRELDAALRAGLRVSLVSDPGSPWGNDLQLRFEGQAQFQPLSYLCGLADAIRRAGGHIHTRTRANHIELGRSELQIELESGKSLRARDLIVATNTPISDRFAMHTKQAAYRTYVIGLRLSARMPPGLFWDTGDPYHYVRLAEGGQVLIVGGEDHKVGQSQNPERAWARLEAWARQRFPTVEAVCSRWSGQIQEPFDGLGFIGRDPGVSEHVYIVTGDSGNGLTHAAIAGRMLCELIEGRVSPWSALYDPSRKPRTRTLPTYVRENANVAVHFASGLLHPSAHKQPETRGHGEVVRSGLSPVARYVTPSGEVHSCSAVCPHLGCVVQWNDAEQSWDCPCHGSRFDPYGRVLTGPAIRDLKPQSSPHDLTKETRVHRELLEQLAHELWQTETSASRHCRREAARLGEDTAPARALLAAAQHADEIMAQLPKYPLVDSAKRRNIGKALGQLFSISRVAVADKLLSNERSYRGTLLGLRHGVDLVRLMRDAAELAGEPALLGLFERWLKERTPLVEAVANELRWFADRPKQANSLIAPRRHKHDERQAS